MWALTLLPSFWPRRSTATGRLLRWLINVGPGDWAWEADGCGRDAACFRFCLACQLQRGNALSQDPKVIDSWPYGSISMRAASAADFAPLRIGGACRTWPLCTAEAGSASTGRSCSACSRWSPRQDLWPACLPCNLQRPLSGDILRQAAAELCCVAALAADTEMAARRLSRASLVLFRDPLL